MFRSFAETRMFFSRKMPSISFTRMTAVVLAMLAWLHCDEAIRAEPPALIVVVSVDQLAQDYLERFDANFSDSGLFRECQSRGACFWNCQHRHAFTYTAPGHAVQLTGCYASE